MITAKSNENSSIIKASTNIYDTNLSFSRFGTALQGKETNFCSGINDHQLLSRINVRIEETAHLPLS